MLQKHLQKRSRVLTNIFPHEEFVLRGLSLALVVVALAYVSLVSASILNVIARKEALTQANALRSSVGLLEERYFTLSEAVTPEKAGSLGLAPVSEMQYLRRSGAVGSATVASNRPL